MSTSRTEYARHYGDFRGVDLSHDHSQVAPYRFAYIKNMYKDYYSGQGEAVETVPGYRKLNYIFKDRNGNPATDGAILGIHIFNDRMYLHKGNSLYNLPKREPANTPTFTALTTSLSPDNKSTSYVFNNRLYILDGVNIFELDSDNNIKQVGDNASYRQPYIPTTYSTDTFGIPTPQEPRNLLTAKFKQTFLCDGEKTEFELADPSCVITHVELYGTDKTTAEGTTVSGNKVTFATAPQKPEDITGTIKYPVGYQGLIVTATNKITNILGRTDAQQQPIDEYQGLSAIHGCTKVCAFDNRIVYSGNPSYPTLIFFTRPNSTGYMDPLYVGAQDYAMNGVGNAKITGLLNVSNTLMVLKEDTEGQDGSVYFYSEDISTQDRVQYAKMQGLAGLGCIGACCNFLDDPVFVSRLGLEAVSKQAVNLERGIEHRSTMVDARLVNEKIDNLRDSEIAEWAGYLVLLVNGNLYLADSRQRFQDQLGNPQYEWYIIEKIGEWKNQYLAYVYASELPISDMDFPEVVIDGVTVTMELGDNVYDIATMTFSNKVGELANEDEGGNDRIQIHPYEHTIYVENSETGEIETTQETVDIPYIVSKEFDKEGELITHAYICKKRDGYVGGTYSPARTLKSVDGILYFGTDSGSLFCFNTDLRDEQGLIPYSYYNFDGRTIVSGCATVMDNCGVPHLTKTTIKKSTVIKTRSFERTLAKIKVRTNNNPYKQVGRINSSLFAFDNIDFGDFSFITQEQSIFAIKEKEKKWVEKQYFIYSDEYNKPFSLYTISYRYYIAGRVK